MLVTAWQDRVWRDEFHDPSSAVTTDARSVRRHHAVEMRTSGYKFGCRFGSGFRLFWRV